jgi:hypothetical protein
MSVGKVFSWDEIKRKEVPDRADFSAVVGEIRQGLEAVEGVFGGVLCGSVLLGFSNQRSDIDCVVVYDPNKRREVATALQGINRMARGLHVPIEFIPLDWKIARTPLHHIRLSFVSHLQFAVDKGGLIKENPLPLLNLEGLTDLEDVRSYLRNKLRSLDKGVVALPKMEPAELHKFLQKVLEAPVHIARKILWWKKAATPDESKRTVSTHYSGIAGAEELKLFTKITDADAKYTTELLVQLRYPDKDQYSRAIGELKDLVWDTLEFVRLSALRLT